MGLLRSFHKLIHNVEHLLEHGMVRLAQKRGFPEPKLHRSVTRNQSKGEGVLLPGNSDTDPTPTEPEEALMPSEI